MSSCGSGTGVLFAAARPGGTLGLLLGNISAAREGWTDEALGPVADEILPARLP